MKYTERQKNAFKVVAELLKKHPNVEITINENVFGKELKVKNVKPIMKIDEAIGCLTPENESAHCVEVNRNDAAQIIELLKRLKDTELST